jgi:hypothetical protein
MTDLPEITERQLRWYRFRRSGLLKPFGSAILCAEQLAGVQAQILPAAGLALWNRTPRFTNSEFQRLLYQDRTLVKLWGQRGTLHLYPSKDWPLICGARSGQGTWLVNRYLSMGGDLDKFHQDAATVVEAARKMPSIGRSDLRNMNLGLDEHLLSSWGGIFAYLVKTGELCHGPQEGGEGRFIHRENWLPGLNWRPPSFSEANIRLARRYLHCYGAASPQDLAYWRGAKSSELKEWLKALEPELTTVEQGGKDLLLLKQDLPTLLEEPPIPSKWPVKLLYRFDPYLLGQKNKDWLVEPEHQKKVWIAAGHIEGNLLVGGRIKGTWRYERKGKTLNITAWPFQTLGKEVWRKLWTQGKKVARFFDLKPGEFRMEEI